LRRTTDSRSWSAWDRARAVGSIPRRATTSPNRHAQAGRVKTFDSHHFLVTVLPVCSFRVHLRRSQRRGALRCSCACRSASIRRSHLLDRNPLTRQNVALNFGGPLQSSGFPTSYSRYRQLVWTVDLAEATTLIGITRARMTQIANMMLLAPKIQSAIPEASFTVVQAVRINEHSLRPITNQPVWYQQCTTHRHVLSRLGHMVPVSSQIRATHRCRTPDGERRATLIFH
jgi:hypothetical protein